MLNPVLTIATQMRLALEAHETRVEAKPRATRSIEALAAVAHSRRRAAPRRLSAPVLRRHAPARRHRDRAAAPAGADRLRRADDGARRVDPGADPDRDAQPRARSRHGADLDQPRSRDRLLAREPHPRDVCGPHHRGRADGRGAAQPAPSLQPRACSNRCPRASSRAATLRRSRAPRRRCCRLPEGCAFRPRCGEATEMCHAMPRARAAWRARLPLPSSALPAEAARERACRGEGGLETVRAAAHSRREDCGRPGQRDRDAHGARARSRVARRSARARSVGLVGESGCGKSTLGRVIAGILPPTSGRSRIAGEPVMTGGRQPSSARPGFRWCSRTRSHRSIRACASATRSRKGRSRTGW